MLRIIAIILAYPLRPVLNRIKQARARRKQQWRKVRLEVTIAFEEVMYFFTDILPFRSWAWGIGAFFAQLRPQPTTVYKNVIIRDDRDDGDWDPGGWP